MLGFNKRRGKSDFGELIKIKREKKHWLIYKHSSSLIDDGQNEKNFLGSDDIMQITYNDLGYEKLYTNFL